MDIDTHAFRRMKLNEALRSVLYSGMTASFDSDGTSLLTLRDKRWL